VFAAAPSKSQPLLTTAARTISVVKPKFSKTRPNIAPYDMSKSKSPLRRPFIRHPFPKPSISPPRVNAAKPPTGNPQQALKDKGVIDSGCSRHITGNMSYLSDFEELNGGYVAFRGNPKGGKITGKGKIKTGKLDFDDVYFIKELKFNLFSFCGLKAIKREFSVPRTPQQNGIAERKNRTLIEATRTLLADSLLPILFWAEAVNTTCYAQNRVLVTKPHNKTPYELLHDALVDGKEHDDDIQKYMSLDIHSSSCGDEIRKQGDKAENKDKDKSPVTRSMARAVRDQVEYHRCSIKIFIPACLLVFFHKRSLKESIKLSRIQNLRKRIRLKRDKSEQNRIKTRQKREAWRSPEKSRAVSVDKARKTKENAERMVKNANTVEKLLKF
nr:ribonuclease H-like domain-containing protein [Tanacetum cinerariifolium]